MKSKELALAAVLAVALVAATLALPAVVDARPAFAVPVHEDEGEGTYRDPASGDWSEAPAATLEMASAPSGLPNASSTTVEEAKLQAVRTDERLFLKLSWADATNDTETGDVGAFADAAAIQLPVDESARPPIAMGGADNPVNVWFWRADATQQELLAGGAGTTTPMNGTVATESRYVDGQREVVFSRDLDASGANRTSVPADEDLDVAIAVWNGSADERSGHKAASDWYYLALGAGPQGPPYELLLWVIAGLAIVFTTLVTIEGVRRTRGDS
ncbi:ethylbenzene dehydrogenase-related protein [Halorientalis halophila]|uniref:ethylbenzene dehydrogenase-related protein n=1 Tax=Halorientalis halophila TaxID=3108499 RepID=UPI00300A95E3